MTDDTSSSATTGDYDVVLLVEDTLSAADAAQIRSLHEGLDEPVRYHVLMPADDAAAAIEASMGSVGSSDVLAVPSAPLAGEDLEVLRQADRERSEAHLAATLLALHEQGADAVGEVTTMSPIDALAAMVTAVDGREAIILTRPHVVAEFFHVDWSARARRHIGVPVLHLLERENFDEQAGGGEGITGV